MRQLRRSALLFLTGLAVVLTTEAPLRAQVDSGRPVGEPRVIEVAICLDTSGSMKPLIDAARLSLWDIVNDLSRLEPTPTVRVALLAYGGRAEGAQSGWVKVRAPLTEDLDLVSERLFEMTTGGGTEYVGRVLRAALEDLAWSPADDDTLRMIFVAGNEPADQDPEVDFRSMGFEARDREFDLYVVYCGQATDAHAETWKELAEAAEGRFATIDLKAATSIVSSPVDREMARLGSALNETYLALGDEGKAGLKMQASQDKKVESLSLAAAAARAETKAGALYGRSWDLIDSVASGRVNLEEVDPARLPKAMRGMTPEERHAYVERVRFEREDLRQRILSMGAERRRHVAQQAERSRPDGAQTFDGVVRGAIRDQLEERGYRPANE